MTVITITIFKQDLFSLIRTLKNKKRKLALTSSHCLGEEAWLDYSLKVVYINQSSKILQFLTRGKHNFEIFSHFQQ